MLKARFSQADVEVLEQKPLYSGFFQMNAYRLRHASFAGASIEVQRELFERGRCVCVLLYDPWQDAVVLLEQFRIGALREPSPWLLELVAGIVEAGETDAELAAREAMEEAGATLLALEPMLEYLSSPGGTNEKVGLYLGCVDAKGLGGIHGLAEEGEDIHVQVVSLAEACQACDNGRINNAATLMAILWLQLHKQRVIARWREQGIYEG
ncbi:NUDIX domain-containing protein [Balneatrix alpica]|uniref:NUDIX domain-containing protein n=1 Tax=Balneatrix alpica TaxID=75684 RepID=UPI00273A4320|nr:NUDIX domain-containing protein [Balneatrix alpica]